MGEIQAIIIEDIAKNIEVLGKLLGYQNMDFIAISDPTKILNYIDDIKKATIVFLDLEMPGLSGYDVYSLLRERARDTKIVAYSAHWNEMGVARALGFDGFLGKPLDVDRFPEQLDRILKSEPVWEMS